MTIKASSDATMKAALLALVVLALAVAWLGYGRGDIVRWFGAFLMCG